MRRIDIDLEELFLTIRPEGKSIQRDNLKELNRFLTKIAGPETASVVVRFMQVWNEEERSTVHEERADVSKRPSDALVSGDQRPENRSRRRRRRRRKAD